MDESAISAGFRSRVKGSVDQRADMAERIAI
jgi:hypothetical protein